VRFRLVTFILSLGVAIPFADAQERAKNPAQERAALLLQKQREMRQQSEQTTRGLEELPRVYKLSEVMQVRSVDNVWILSSTLTPPQNNRAVRLAVEGLSGVNVLTMSTTVKNNIPDSFTFANTSFSDPRAIQVTSHVTVNGSFSLARYAHLLDGYHNVTLNQGNVFDEDWGRPGAGGRAAVKFSVQIGDSQGGNQINMTYTAPDFATLRRQHPREIDLYLRPVLRQFQMESVLAADPMIAWQVFADELKPTGESLKAVNALLPALDSDSFVDRARALESLQRIGLPVAVAIRHLDRTRLSDQQNLLLDAAMAPFTPQRGADVGRLRGDIDFLLDCLYCEDGAIRAAALDALQKKVGRLVKFDINADLPARSAAIDAMRE